MKSYFEIEPAMKQQNVDGFNQILFGTVPRDHAMWFTELEEAADKLRDLGWVFVNLQSENKTIFTKSFSYVMTFEERDNVTALFDTMREEAVFTDRNKINGIGYYSNGIGDPIQSLKIENNEIVPEGQYNVTVSLPESLVNQLANDAGADVKDNIINSLVVLSNKVLDKHLPIDNKLDMSLDINGKTDFDASNAGDSYTEDKNSDEELDKINQVAVLDAALKELIEQNKRNKKAIGDAVYREGL